MMSRFVELDEVDSCGYDYEQNLLFLCRDGVGFIDFFPLPNDRYVTVILS